MADPVNSLAALQAAPPRHVPVTATLVWRLPEPSYRFSKEQKAREAIQ
jgi:hypothetical protein